MIVMPDLVNMFAQCSHRGVASHVDILCAPHTLAIGDTLPSLPPSFLPAARIVRMGPILIGLAACAQATSNPGTVPIAFGRWRPPQGQACYSDAFQPRELPALSAMLDSAAVAAVLRTRPEGSVLIALSFDASGRTERARVIDRRMPVSTADSIRGIIEAHLRVPRSDEGWGARLHASTGESASLAPSSRTRRS